MVNHYGKLWLVGAHNQLADVVRVCPLDLSFRLWYYKIPTGPSNMPQLDESNWNQQSRAREPIVIEGEAIDVTPSTRDDTYAEPPFPTDTSRDREPTLGEGENLFSMIPYGPVRALKVEHLHSKSQLLEQLARTIPDGLFPAV